MAESLAFNMDCMEAMKEFPDKFFDLAVVDPPYWNADQGKISRTGGTWSRKYQREETGDSDIRDWDIAPKQEYFLELFRISKNQVIWGGNYFSLPPARCFLVWRKLNIPIEGFTMSPIEYAWTSFNENADLFEAFSSSTGSIEKRFHPTQKPISLYAWIFKKHSEPGMKILDTHLGSGSSRIAAYDAGLNFYGYEINKQYFDLQEERFKRHSAQQNLFLME